jgi:glycerophosphoryl diester phosphodiesterase
MNTVNEPSVIPANFDWQGHRGCRGLMPENSVVGFIHALQFPIKTLELDVVLSKDSVVIVSHEPWFSGEICACDSLKENNLFKMTYDEIKEVTCGLKKQQRFAEQKLIKTFKPSLIDVVNGVKSYCSKNNLPLPQFNIELKSKPEWDNEFLPDPKSFVEQVYKTIRFLGIEDISIIQSFDPRVLNLFQKMSSTLSFAFLTENGGNPLGQMQVLNQLPAIYSPYYETLNKNQIDDLHKLNIKVIPWTVNDHKDMRKLIDMGVDGIITDYPNLIEELK